MSSRHYQVEYDFDFLTIDDLKAIPKPPWLVENVLRQGCLAQLYGGHGSWKTFVALNWALSVAAGVEWMPGQPVERGTVVYIIGEGIDEFWPRVEAWLKHRNLSEDAIRDHIRFIPEAVQLADYDHIDAFLTGISEKLVEPPCLLVVDTLSRSLVGIEENAAKDMTQVVAAVQEIHDATGTATLLIHHKPYNADRGRGSTVMPGALDTIVGIGKQDKSKMTAELYCDKQKNSSEFEPMQITMVSQDDSLVATFGPAEPLSPTSLTGPMRLMWDKLESKGSAGLTGADWLETTDIPKSTFYRLCKQLVDNKLVDKVGPLYIARTGPKLFRFPKTGLAVPQSHP